MELIGKRYKNKEEVLKAAQQCAKASGIAVSIKSSKTKPDTVGA